MPSISRQHLFAPEDVDNSSPDTLVTVPTNHLLINARVRFTNHTGSASHVTAWAVPSGGTAGNDNIALPQTTINPNEFLDVDVPQIAGGGTYQAQAQTATSITAQPMEGAYYVT